MTRTLAPSGLDVRANVHLFEQEEISYDFAHPSFSQ
jgi:hypothetical protein